MYKISLILLFVLLYNNGFTQIGSLQYIDSTDTSAGVRMFASADLDNDGDDELIASFSASSGKLAYYENLSSGIFSSIQIIDSIPFARGVAVGDFNNDNWKDLVAIGGINNEAWIYFNDSGSFSGHTQLDSNISIFLNDVVVADFDLNGSDDIVIIGQHSIDFYRNDGSGNFSKEVILSTSTAPGVLECLDLSTADMDNDGDMDLVCAETEGVVVYINSGSGIFTPHYYSVIMEVGMLIHSFDIDNDNDIDVLMNNNSGDVKWFSNDGNGVLTFEQILTNVPDMLSFTSIDYNNDGYKDIFGAYQNNVAIYLNDSIQSFSTSILIHNDNSLVMGPVHLANMDNLGLKDYVWTGVNRHIVYHTNQINTLIPENRQVKEVVLYPNPTNGIVKSTSEIPFEKIDIYSSKGNMITTFSRRAEFDLSGFPNGTYFVNITLPGREKEILQKVVKK